MFNELSNKEIGSRIMKIRKIKGFSQEELASLINISRPSLAQIELGNRKISINELLRLSISLGYSIDKLLAKEFVIEDEIPGFTSGDENKNEERISVPNLMVKKFKNVLLYILERCAGKPNVGETVLYKLLYFSDFNYYEVYEDYLTGAIYKKLPYGPVPQKINSIINNMINKGEIKRIKTEFHGYLQTRFIPLVKTDLTELKASEIEIIDQVINQLSDYYAAAISDYSHNDIPWKATAEGEVIDYELAFYRDKPYSVRNYDDLENEI